jgi:hypothetical protein
MKQPAGSVYYEFRICGLRGDTLVGGYDRVGVQFRVVEFGVDVTRRPLPQLQRDLVGTGLPPRRVGNPAVSAVQ